MSSVLKKMQKVSTDSQVTGKAYQKLSMKLDTESTATFNRWLDLVIQCQEVRKNKQSTP